MNSLLGVQLGMQSFCPCFQVSFCISSGACSTQNPIQNPSSQAESSSCIPRVVVVLAFSETVVTLLLSKLEWYRTATFWIFKLWHEWCAKERAGMGKAAVHTWGTSGHTVTLPGFEIGDWCAHIVSMSGRSGVNWVETREGTILESSCFQFCFSPFLSTYFFKIYLQKYESAVSRFVIKHFTTNPLRKYVHVFSTVNSFIIF